ncbi:MAG: preprotein translocase subunit SecG [Bacteroidetes bacterium HGW-Bacteroidetes-17]|nr:MAG: preprotein translocase subunit SecG [Bacteroidetes bacterium HGW-Bacteroidetes-17]
MGTYILVSVLILITCILLILVVLVQNSKGGGLASNFAGSNHVELTRLLLRLLNLLNNKPNKLATVLKHKTRLIPN